MEEAGFLEPIDIVNVQWDARKDFRPDVDDAGVDRNDCEWIGENEHGIWIRRHPVAALADEPLLWDVWTEWRFGQHEITADDFRTKSNFELEAKAALIAAEQRKMKRKVKERGDDEG